MCSTSCSNNKADIEAVKKANTFIAGYNSDKTVNEVIQNVAGLKGVVSWNVFTPTDKDYAPEVKVVDVTIKSTDSVLYKTILLQFIYNSSTGLVEQGGIEVDGKNYSNKDWWEFYDRVLIAKEIPDISQNKPKEDKVYISVENGVEYRTDEPPRENSEFSDPNDPRSYPNRGISYTYTSYEWMDMTKGFEYGAEHPYLETVKIYEGYSRFYIDFGSIDDVMLEIVKTIPYEYGTKYRIIYDGKEQELVKSPALNGGIDFSCDNWLINECKDVIASEDGGD